MKVFLASLQTGSKQETKSFEERYMTGRPYTSPGGGENPIDQREEEGRQQVDNWELCGQTICRNIRYEVIDMMQTAI